MIPPSSINVLDKHNGFTAITVRSNTLWRPGNILKKTTQGALIDYKENSFYQLNNDVTMARYKVAGYRYVVVCWFDNKTGNRIA